MIKLNIVAGREAFALITKHGLSPDMVKVVAAAAGGPKWFTTYGLMRYIISSLIPASGHKCHFIGSSVGAWQMAAAVSPDPAASIDRLKSSYAEHIYSNKPDRAEISSACSSFISAMLGANQLKILGQNEKHLHIITSYGRSIIDSDHKGLLAVSFGSAAFANAISRRNLKYFIDRVIFSNCHELPYNTEKDVLPTSHKRLNEQNLTKVLRASGAIPLLMDGVTSIDPTFIKSFWDGGITDYHITFPYDFEGEGLVLHPHFGPYVLQGWFDKKLPWNRIANRGNMSKVLLMFPSREYIESLPIRRISDLTDFKYFGQQQEKRVQYWNTIADKGFELAEEFDELIQTDKIVERMQLYDE